VIASAGIWHAPAGADARAAPAAVGPPASLTAAFRPERLGAPTTVSFGIRIDPPAQSEAAALSELEVGYPLDLGLATSGLGVQACDPTALEAVGTRACPADSKMGQGSALLEVPFGPTLVRERFALGIYAAPSTDGYLHLAILAHGAEPVLARVVLPAVLLPGRLKVTVPPIASLPGAPFATLISMRATLGGALTYYERVHRRTIAYRPRGIGLPDRCPRGGWRLAASFVFVDGQRSRAATAIPCPHER
jgi:hypothetical protein